MKVNTLLKNKWEPVLEAFKETLTGTCIEVENLPDIKPNIFRRRLSVALVHYGFKGKFAIRWTNSTNRVWKIY